MTKISYCNENQKILVVIKLMALVIAMVMVVAAMNMGAFAATTQDSSISVTGLAAGDVVTPYKVLEWVCGSTGWAFTSAFSSLTAEDLAKITGNPSATPPVAGQIDFALAKKIAALASGGTAEPALTGTTWTKENPDPGLYMEASIIKLLILSIKSLQLMELPYVIRVRKYMLRFILGITEMVWQWT